MANYKPKITGYYNKIIENTEINKCKNNYIFFSIDTESKHINYIINEENIKNFLQLIIKEINSKPHIQIKEIITLMKEDVYKVYKTKVAEKRVPLLILNFLVIINVLYTDNGVDFEVKDRNITIDIIKTKLDSIIC